jgi:signal transduction histidine kinase
MLRQSHFSSLVTLILPLWGLGITAVVLTGMNIWLIASLVLLGTGAAALKVRRIEGDENLARADRVNRAVLMAIPCPVFVVGDDNKIIQLNQPAESLVGKSGIRPGLPLKLQSILDNCRKTQNDFMPQEMQDAIPFSTQEEEFYYLPQISRIDPEIAAQCGWVILLQNVSSIRRLDDMKTNLLAVMSHEVKTPLTGIRMALLLPSATTSATREERNFPTSLPPPVKWRPTRSPWTCSFATTASSAWMRAISCNPARLTAIFPACLL